MKKPKKKTLDQVLKPGDEMWAANDDGSLTVVSVDDPELDAIEAAYNRSIGRDDLNE